MDRMPIDYLYLDELTPVILRSSTSSCRFDFGIDRKLYKRFLIEIFFNSYSFHCSINNSEHCKQQGTVIADVCVNVSRIGKNGSFDPIEGRTANIRYGIYN
ncbi:hypothetical protein DERP_000569 [Dermatophagoides pteronyssinus]|uniref:Uncharacterized protein n=1 Tax=Dermatophagoides pteronyssinus TaxID=6956 RepID=A0ABQ8J0K8_DERPT|nr:hypothetical protein DERP_000569 [Dermatophagoides pteronyssinus]